MPFLPYGLILSSGESDTDGEMGREIVRASAIAEDLLQTSGAALISGDFQTFLMFFQLPAAFETEAGRRDMETEAEMRDAFDAVHMYFMRNGISDYVRRCIVAEYRGPNEIITSHESRLMNGTTLLADSFPAISTLRRVDGVWKVVETRYTVIDQPWLQQALHKDGGAG